MTPANDNIPAELANKLPELGLTQPAAMPDTPPAPTGDTPAPTGDTPAPTPTPDDAQKAAAKAATVAAAEAAKQARAAEKAAKAAEKLAAATAKADAKKAEKAAKVAEAAQAKEAKAAEKALKAKEKAETKAKPKREPNTQPIQNGIRRPKAEGLCGRAWAVFDEVSAKNGGPASIGESLPIAEARGLRPGNVKAEYAQWRKFHGVTGRVAAPKPAPAIVPNTPDQQPGGDVMQGVDPVPVPQSSGATVETPEGEIAPDGTNGQQAV